MRLKLPFNSRKSYIIVFLLLLSYYLVSYYGISDKSYNPTIGKSKLYNKTIYNSPYYGKKIYYNFVVTPKPRSRKEWKKLGKIVNNKIRTHFENEFQDTNKGLIDYDIYEKTDIINEDFKNYTKSGSIAISPNSGDRKTVTLTEAGKKYLLIRMNMNKSDCRENIVGKFYYHGLFRDSGEYFIEEHNDINNCIKDKNE